MKRKVLTKSTKYFTCSNTACSVLFPINIKEIEFGNGIHLCPECFIKTKTHHTIECANCLSIIDFLPIEYGEEVVTYYTNKCTSCNGTIDDEVHLSKIKSIELYTHC